MSLRDRYEGVPQRYYDQRRAALVLRYGEDQVAEWESVIGDHLSTRTGHLPPLEAVLLAAGAYEGGSAAMRNQVTRMARAGEVYGQNDPRLPVTLPSEADPYVITLGLDGPVFAGPYATYDDAVRARSTMRWRRRRLRRWPGLWVAPAWSPPASEQE